MAANGTEIAVYGEAVLEFEGEGGGEGSMLFLDADVKKPLGAVSAMEDEGNTVGSMGGLLKMMRRGNAYTSRGKTTRM